MARLRQRSIARFEAQILAECGFRLDLSSCAATGVTDDLVYVSPKSGRAVSAEAGAPWRDRLLPLPPFLREGAPLEAQPSAEEIADGFRLTGFFLARDLFSLHGEPLPDSAGRFSQGGRAGSAIGGGNQQSPQFVWRPSSDLIEDMRSVRPCTHKPGGVTHRSMSASSLKRCDYRPAAR